MTKLWEKNNTKSDSLVIKFTSDEDSLLDLELVEEDCQVNQAYARSLIKAGIFSKKEFLKIKKALKEIIELHKQGEFSIGSEQEDIHTAIENYLIQELGETGKKIHAGKSRNDQIATDISLYSKKKLSEVIKKGLVLKKEINAFLEKNKSVEMPGYTHFRKAMPSSIGVWVKSFGESLDDDITLMKRVMEWIDKCPLGAAAGYGSSLGIDRAELTEELGFSSTQKNPLYAINSRSKYESAVLFVLSELMLTLNKLATDIIIFSSEHFGFLELAEEICTGSSIMPHKKNPDLFEVIRAKNSEMQSLLFHSLVNQNSLPSGYNRDMQFGKKPLIKGFCIVIQCLEILTHILPKISVNKKKCASAITKEMRSAEKAIEIAKKGVPFRDAYKRIKKGKNL